MHNTVAESDADQDLGSGGALVLPDMLDSSRRIRHLAVGAGKDANIYLVDRANMGKFRAAGDTNIYQEGVALFRRQGISAELRRRRWLSSAAGHARPDFWYRMRFRAPRNALFQDRRPPPHLIRWWENFRRAA
jgi:hypothetical protein